MQFSHFVVSRTFRTWSRFQLEFAKFRLCFVFYQIVLRQRTPSIFFNDEFPDQDILVIWKFFQSYVLNPGNTDLR